MKSEDDSIETIFPRRVEIDAAKLVAAHFNDHEELSRISITSDPDFNGSAQELADEVIKAIESIARGEFTEIDPKELDDND